MERYYSVRETAEQLRVSPDTVRRWLRAGKLRAIRFGQAYRIPQSALDSRGAEGSADKPVQSASDHNRGSASGSAGGVQTNGVMDRETYLKRLEYALQLARELEPILSSIVLPPGSDPADILEEIREERDRDLSGI